MTEFGYWIRRRWKVLSIIAVVLLALSSVAYAYLKLTSSSTSPLPTSVFQSYPLELRMELDKTEFQLGELITVRVFLKNISNKTITVTFAYPKPFGLNVTDANGTLIYRYAHKSLFPQVIFPVSLEPSKELGQTFVWNQVDNDENPVSPGTYNIIGCTGAKFFSDDVPSLSSLTVPPITITTT
jgi:hypothetical protein